MGKPKQITPKDLVAATKQQLIKKGQGKITLKNVAEVAGVTQGVVYYHFKTKDQLLIGLFEEFEEQELQELIKFKNERKEKASSEVLKAYLSEEMYKAQVSSEQQQLLLELAALALHQKEMKNLFGQAIHKKAGELSELAGGSQALGRLIMAISTGLAFQALFDPSFNKKEAYELAKEWITRQG
ncbi:TetR/AcrR family transcriptional regulator [Ammoniphilus sp. CFH 90114]|uniref:TetR/AcrR family transcriptional regulator n=1 Tax=Ammoniphilus sp. CFH 90114 TaxID=2493665 RepID=UPI00100EF8D8|nr:TetR/AcrR family transcriptional regulator [Ammoniphilus sp. CFH 90114]RXT14957.1 TetR/AcrR family transcriptional regulator [Ammoniphilus sp. CFH 90114]